MAHIITGLDSPDYLSERIKNEAVCDLLGSYLCHLAEMIAVTEAEKAFLDINPATGEKLKGEA